MSVYSDEQKELRGHGAWDRSPGACQAGLDKPFLRNHNLNGNFGWQNGNF